MSAAVLEVPQPAEPATPIVPQEPIAPTEPDPVTAPEPDAPREDPIDPPATPAPGER